MPQTVSRYEFYNSNYRKNQFFYSSFRLANSHENHSRSAKLPSPRENMISGPRLVRPFSPNKTAITEIRLAHIRPATTRIPHPNSLQTAKSTQIIAYNQYSINIHQLHILKQQHNIHFS